MGKQFITTVNAANSHTSDITSVAITNRYTVTVCSDGYACFWDNKQDEVHDPHAYVHRHLINKAGIHHVAVYENTIPAPDGPIKVVLVAFACFDGSVAFRYINETAQELQTADFGDFATQFWAPAFYRDAEGKRDLFVCTHASGTTHVYELTVAGQEGGKLAMAMEKVGELTTNVGSFPNTLSVSPAQRYAAVGYVNGDVQIYDLDALKVVYTFHSTDLVASGRGTASTNSTCRAVRFSPGGSLLAVARDNQSAGSINLYDVKFGENVGALTSPSHSTVNTIGGFAHEGWVMGLSFDEEGRFLASCGFDRCVRVWNLDTREREATIVLSASDLDTDKEGLDKSVASGVEFIRKGVRGGAGGDTNSGLVVVSFDRGVRWYREAGGI